jgi:hypothetical protein
VHVALVPLSFALSFHDVDVAYGCMWVSIGGWTCRSEKTDVCACAPFYTRISDCLFVNTGIAGIQ